MVTGSDHPARPYDPPPPGFNYPGRVLSAGHHFKKIGTEADYMKRDMSFVVWQEGKWFVAQCLDIDIASQGLSESEAIENLRDALKLYFRPPVATITPGTNHLAEYCDHKSLARFNGVTAEGGH